MADKHGGSNGKPAHGGSGASQQPAAKKTAAKDGPHPEREPELISVDTKSAPGKTVYLKTPAIKTGGGPMMGVYIPEGLKPSDTVDVILYIHGNKIIKEGKDRVWHKDWNIDKIWGYSTFPIREQLNKSGRPFILIAPTLGSADQAGDMTERPDIVLDQAMKGLKQYVAGYGRGDNPPTVGQIILAGHSGAGPIMLDMANNLGKYKKNLKEVWGFDVMYGPHECDWSQLAGGTEAPNMYFYFNGTWKRSLETGMLSSGLDNVYVMRGDQTVMLKGRKTDKIVEHDLLVQRFFFERLQRIGDKNQDDEDRRKKAWEMAKDLKLKRLECPQG